MNTNLGVLFLIIILILILIPPVLAEGIKSKIKIMIKKEGGCP